MSNSFDENEQFIRQFIIETEEHIEAIEKNILALENNLTAGDESNPETINELFRAIHTVKGLSGMLEFTQLFNYTHLWETLLDKVRKKKEPLSATIIEVSFDGLDLLGRLLEQIKQTGTDAGIDIEEILHKFEAILNPVTTQTQEGGNSELTETEEFEGIKLPSIFLKNLLEFEKESLRKALNEDKNIYHISLYLNKDCFNQDISYLSTCYNLEFIGEIINVSPNTGIISALDHFEPDLFDLEMHILFVSEKNQEEVYRTLKNRTMKVNVLKSGPETVNEKSIAPVKTEKALAVEPVESIEISGEDVKRPANSDTDPSQLKNDQIEQAVSEQFKKTKFTSQDTIRVETSRLDNLLALLGEQVISKAQLEHLSNELLKILQEKEKIAQNEKLFDIAENFNETISSFSRLSNELQEIVMHIRMLPIGNVFNRFQRIVRDLSKELNKKVNLLIDGEDTELDKTIIEEISDPLIHVIRNAIDHGIEAPEVRQKLGKKPEGILHFNAYQQGNSIVIMIEDDGQGLNLQKIREKGIEKNLIRPHVPLSDNEIANLIFQPGFSTAQQVTGVSGRGVGMDVVSKNIARLKGTIDIETKAGEGTKFIIKLPLTLAIIQALLIDVEGHTFALPLASVVESYRARPEEIKLVNNKPVLKLRERVLPILYFQDYFKLAKQEKEKKYLYVVVIGVAENRVGFVVDRLIGQQEIVIKPLKDPLVSIRGIAGATLLGEGVTLIIDPIPIIYSNQSKRNFEVSSMIR